MTFEHFARRRAAILIESLDTATAGYLMAQMSADEADQLRLAIDGLGPIDPVEQQAVIAEFCGCAAPAPGDGIELDAGLAERIANLSDAAEPGAVMLERLQHLSARQLHAMLSGETPPVLAAVLAYLPAARAGELIACFPRETQVTLVERLTCFEAVDPRILADVEQALAARLAVVAPPSTSAIVPLSINLPLPAEEEAEEELCFDDLAQLEDESLARLAGAVDPELLVLAMAGASSVLLERLLKCLPNGRARQVRKRLANMGPVRLSDVEEAQLAILRFSLDSFSAAA